MDIKYIYWFSYYNLSEPGIRYRGKYFLDALKSRYGIGYSIIYTGYRIPDIMCFLKVYLSVLLVRKKGSLIVFQKIRTNRIYASLLKLLLYVRRSGTLYDIDDPDYLLFSESTIQFFIKNVSDCTTGSASLMEYAKRFNPNVFLLTSPVISHAEIKTKKNHILAIGWIGYYEAHKENLEQIFFPALKEIDFPVRLVILGVSRKQDIIDINEYFAGNSNVVIEMPVDIDWLDEMDVYRRIKGFDIGVSPLLPTELNIAKSAFKLKQYFSCGVPVLASPVGENCRFLKDGANGFFCTTPHDFKRAITSVNEMDNHRYMQLSQNVVESIPVFGMESNCKSFLDYFKNRF